MNREEELAARMHAFRARFAERAASQRIELAEALKAGDQMAVRGLCHSLAGNAGLFGFTALGDLARSVEHAIDQKDAGREQALAQDLLAALDSIDQTGV